MLYFFPRVFTRAPLRAEQSPSASWPSSHGSSSRRCPAELPHPLYRCKHNACIQEGSYGNTALANHSLSKPAPNTSAVWHLPSAGFCLLILLLPTCHRQLTWIFCKHIPTFWESWRTQLQLPLYPKAPGFALPIAPAGAVSSPQLLLKAALSQGRFVLWLLCPPDFAALD